MYKYQQDEESSLTASCDSFISHEITSDKDLLHEKELQVINYDKYFERKLNSRNNNEGSLDLEKNLSTTLNRLTKNKSSVELILEVEMVKTDYKKKVQNKISDSLVEVTVIHTNNSDNLENEKKERKTFPVRKIKHSESETGSMKRRKWFDRVINNHLQKIESTGNHDKHSRPAAESDYFHNITNKLHEQSEVKHTSIQNYSNNNNENNTNGTYVPLQIHENGMYLKNQMKQKRKVKKHTSHEKTRNHKKYLETNQPFSKNNEIQKIEKALVSLKHEINSKIDIRNKHSETEGYVYNLGKVINNILTKIIEKPESYGREQNKVIVDLQPVMSQSKLINYKNKTKCKITGDSLKKESPILTQFMQNNIDRNVISTHQKNSEFLGYDNDKNLDMKLASVPDNINIIMNEDIKNTESLKEPIQKDAQVQVESLYINGIEESKLIDSKCFKIANSQFTSKEHIHKFCKNKSKFTVRKNVSYHQLGSSKKHYRKTKTKIHKSRNVNNSHEYLWMWDGQKLGICFDLKKRIETLIIRELQNLALKESFQYSISQISDNFKLREPSTSITFLCHLDVSDKKIKHISRTINKNCSDYNPTHSDIKLNPSDRRHIYGKCEYEESTALQCNGNTLNTIICKDCPIESVVTKEHLVPDVQWMHISTSKVNKENKIGDIDLPETTKIMDIYRTCSSHFNKNCDSNTQQLVELHVNKTNKCPLPVDSKQHTYKHSIDQRENIEVKYFNMNWAPESGGTSNHFMNIYTKEEKFSNLTKNGNVAEANFSKQSQIAEIKENKMTKKKIRKVEAESKSDESLWNKIKKQFQQNNSFDQTLQKQIQQKTINTCSEGTHNTQSTVEIELDLKNFKSILEKTKRKSKYKTERDSENKSRKHKCGIPLVNSDEYTKSLLIETGKKLEEYIKGKEEKKSKKKKDRNLVNE